MSVDVVNDPDTQIVLGAGKTIGASANGTSSPERSVLFMSRLKAFWRLLNLPCQGMCRLASDSLDRDLGRLALRARSHLLCCTSCRRFERQIRFLRFAMRRSQGTSRTESSFPVPICQTKYVSGSAAPSA